MAYFVDYRECSTIRDGSSIHFVTVYADTAADIPEPQDNWEVGSWLHVLEGGGSLYTLGNDRTWYPQGIVVSAETMVQDTAAVNEVQDDGMSSMTEEPSIMENVAEESELTVMEPAAEVTE